MIITFFRYGRGYIPLNSLTLGTRLRQQQEPSESSSEPSKGVGKVKKHQNSSGEAWWQMLPKEKVHQNKVIRKKLASIQNSVPKWPWMKGYQKKTEGASTFGTRLATTSEAPSYTDVKFPSTTNSTVSSSTISKTTTSTRVVTKSTIKTSSAKPRCDH